MANGLVVGGVGEGRLPPLMRVEEACELLRIKRSTGYRAVAGGELPSIRIGRRVYVPTGQLLTLLGFHPIDGEEPVTEEPPGGVVGRAIAAAMSPERAG